MVTCRDLPCGVLLLLARLAAALNLLDDPDHALVSLSYVRSLLDIVHNPFLFCVGEAREPETRLWMLL
jgi:hypothetical protein